jgi:hypothetical protein
MAVRKPFRDDAWLAGFTDGEGSFTITRVGGEGAHYWVPRFCIELRADDVAIIRALHAEFGGRIQAVGKRSPGREPSLQWNVRSKRQMADLVSYFDRFPLRAKKARDYEIWREAVIIYMREGSRAALLPVLAQALRETRQFDGEVVELPASPQLRLIEEDR